jgi:ABC-type sulfate transport system permease component
VKVGDIVRIKSEDAGRTLSWPEVYGEIGVIVALAKRLYIPTAKVMVLGEVDEFDLDELEKVNESG